MWQMITRIPDVLTAAQVRHLRSLLLAGTFEDGRATASGNAANVKRNLQLGKDPETRKQADDLVMQSLMNNPTFGEQAFPKAVVRPTYNSYDAGMAYGDHVDAPFLNHGRVRADLSLTLFLSEPSDYDGGELVIQAGAGELGFKYPAGDVVMYPTTSLHRVTPVTRGSRLAAVTWVESYVPDAHQRQILVDFGTAKFYFDEHAADVPAAHALRNALFNLTRMWWRT